MRHCALLVCCLLFFPIAVHSDEEPPPALGVTLEWDPNPEPEVSGYNVYVGRQSGNYTRVIDAGSHVIVRLSPLDPGITYYFAVTAKTSEGLESPFSDEVSYTVPIDGIRAVLAPLAFAAASAKPAHVEFSGKPGFRYFVQATENLSDWQTLATFSPGAERQIVWEDPETFLHELRFYRLVVQLP